MSFFQAHDTAVAMMDWTDSYRSMRSPTFREARGKKQMAWPPEAPNEIASASYDGRILMTDIRNPSNRIALYRQRGLIFLSATFTILNLTSKVSF